MGNRALLGPSALDGPTYRLLYFVSYPNPLGGLPLATLTTRSSPASTRIRSSTTAVRSARSAVAT